MNPRSLISFSVYSKLIPYFNKIIPYRHKILFSSTFAVFLFGIVAKTLELKKSRKKLSKSQRKDLLKARLFFKGVYHKIRLEITGNEGIKYSKMQSFLERVTNKKTIANPNQKALKEDKVFNCILNNYLNRKQEF